MVFNLDELDNSNNLENRSPRNTSLTYHVSPYDDSTHYMSLSIRKLRMESLSLWP